MLCIKSANLVDNKINDSADTMMLTIFLKHQQDEIWLKSMPKSKDTEFWKASPPDGVKVIGYWFIMGARPSRHFCDFLQVDAKSILRWNNVHGVPSEPNFRTV